MAPREVFTLIEERFMSGKGVLQIPQDADWRHFRIWIRVYRLPEVNYVNNRFNPQKGNYANINFMAQGHVFRNEVLDYTQEVYDLPAAEPCSFLINALACNFVAIENLLCIISPLVGGPPCVPGDTIYLDAIKSPIDELLFVCRDETALQVTLYGLKQDSTCPESVPNPKLPAGAPTPVPDLLPDESADVSPPYVEPDDGGNTVPFPGDSDDPVDPNFPAGTDCNPVVIQYRLTRNGGVVTDETSILRGVVNSFAPNVTVPTSPGQPYAIISNCRGFNTQACQPQGDVVVFSQGGGGADTLDAFEILSVT